MIEIPIPLERILAARDNLAGRVLRTPLVRLDAPDAPAEIWLKLENLQPIGSFKLRGAANAMALTDRAELERGVWTASAGNMAQGVAWFAREMGVPAAVVVPETAPRTKLEAIERLGARIVKATVEDWFEVFDTRRYPGMDGLFVHAFADPAVIAGNGTIGLEILDDLPDPDAIVVPYGGGGLICGIASAVRQLKHGTMVFASEVDTGAPLAASLAAGEPSEVEFTPSWVDGIGGPFLAAGMWEPSRALIDGSLVMSHPEIAEATRALVERARVVAEGAGASSVAAALAGRAGTGRVVCVVSGGNIDTGVLRSILDGGVPGS